MIEDTEKTIIHWYIFNHELQMINFLICDFQAAADHGEVEASPDPFHKVA